MINRLMVLLSVMLFTASFSAAADNVILIIIDDMRVDDRIATPNIDALASTGTRYASAYATGTYCLTSRTGIMMSMHTEALGNAPVFGYQFTQAYADIYNNPSVSSLPEILSAAGYLTASAGKIFHSADPTRWDVNGPTTVLSELMIMEPGPYGTFVPEPETGIPRDQLIADWASEFLLNVNQPFFLAVGLYQPHIPWVIPQIDYEEVDGYIAAPSELDHVPAKGVNAWRIAEYRNILASGRLDDYTRAYMSATSHTDMLVGQLTAALAQSGQAAHIVVISDHGYHLGEKSHWRKNTFWEPTLKVPLVISSPDYPPGVVHKPVSLLDIAPTILAMADVPAPAKFEGMPLINTTTPVRAYHRNGSVTVGPNGWKFIDFDLTTLDPDDLLTYHLPTDPLEQVNLAGTSINGC